MKNRKLRRWLIISLSLLLIGFCLTAWIIGGRLLAPANRMVGNPPEELPFESFSIDSESGSALAAWYLTREDSQATILLLHPIRSDRRSMLGRAKLFFEAGYSILMIDMQAHGESRGENITVGFLERHDVQAAVNFLHEKNPNHKIGVVGSSLGGAAALLASPLEIDGLVLEAVYPTVSEAIHNRISMRLGPLSYLISPALLCQFQPRLGISPSQLRPVDRIAEVDCPILVAVGSLDEHTTLAESQFLYDKAQQPKRFVVFEGAAHIDLFAYNPTLYEEKILSFMRSHIPAKIPVPDSKD